MQIRILARVKHQLDPFPDTVPGVKNKQKHIQRVIKYINLRTINTKFYVLKKILNFALSAWSSLQQSILFLRFLLSNQDPEPEDLPKFGYVCGSGSETLPTPHDLIYTLKSSVSNFSFDSTFQKQLMGKKHSKTTQFWLTATYVSGAMGWMQVGLGIATLLLYVPVPVAASHQVTMPSSGAHCI